MRSPLSIAIQARRMSRNLVVLALFTIVIACGFLLMGAYTASVAVVWFVIGGTSLIAALVGMKWPGCNLVLRPLSSFGPPMAVAAAIDAELARIDRVTTFGPTHHRALSPFNNDESVVLSPTWLLQFTNFGLHVARLGDAVWIYKKIFTREYGYFMKDRTYSVVVHQKNGRCTDFQQTEDEVDSLLQELHRRLPFVRFGF